MRVSSPSQIAVSVTLLLPAFCLAQLPPEESLAPFVPAPQAVVEQMLRAAEVKQGETVYDLGCGDGRVLITAAKEFGARAVGVEIKDKLVTDTRKKVAAMGLMPQVEIIHGNALNVDLSKADVVTLFLLTKSNELLRPNFEKYLRPSARVVSYYFEVPGWKPWKVEEVSLDNKVHKIYVYKMELIAKPRK